MIYAENNKTIDKAQAGIFEYIELFYNRVRRHSAIGFMSPNVLNKNLTHRVSEFRGEHGSWCSPRKVATPFKQLVLHFPQTLKGLLHRSQNVFFCGYKISQYN